jgi:alpha-tubulin suppressor-like RCC1 family protein
MACHTICVTTDGKCYAFGRNDKGQLGVGDFVSRNRPTLIKALEHIKISKVAVGKTHTLFLSSGGEVWVAGSNSFGQLGVGKTSDTEEKARQQPSIGSTVLGHHSIFHYVIEY